MGCICCKRNSQPSDTNWSVALISFIASCAGLCTYGISWRDIADPELECQEEEDEILSSSTGLEEEEEEERLEEEEEILSSSAWRTRRRRRSAWRGRRRRRRRRRRKEGALGKNGKKLTQ
ncbi:uncharacterized protein A4U43_C10F11190 [Asparagus officinalis]|uniref:Uncharacterized protein n=1 Tax=Asparagus officinalis TaxID=4686 RepID=A0A5P1E593_ASPOF|nr:uncharacterized protein A4U43_C10F11190 [Asparagus officinalis]